MPKATAATFDDFGTFEPRRRVAPRKTQSAASKGRQGKRTWYFRLNMTKVARIAAVGMGATLAGGIMVNALMMQKDRHPAPLFARTLALPKQAIPPVDTPSKSASPAAVVVPPAPTPVTRPVPTKPRHAAAADAPDKAVTDDAIARLLHGGGDKPAPKANGASGGKTVTGVQHALAKLGFAVKPSGTFDTQTRKAIEAFEKGRHLPVRGEMSPRLVKILSAESVMKLD